MTHAEKCPVCEGKGRIPTEGYTVAEDDGRECHGCGGKGWVEVHDTIERTTFVPGADPYVYPYYGPWTTFTLPDENATVCQSDA